MSGGATPAELDAAEAVLGWRLPPEHRAILAVENGGEHRYADVFLVIFGTDSLVAFNRQIERHPGFLAFGSAGSVELIGFDMRTTPPPVVMMDIRSADWEEALYQAASLNEFMAQRAAGEDLRWIEPYRPSP